jgi:hypothetical protein
MNKSIQGSKNKKKPACLARQIKDTCKRRTLLPAPSATMNRTVTTTFFPIGGGSPSSFYYTTDPEKSRKNYLESFWLSGFLSVKCMC